jgi:hypothetical protein
MQSLLTHSLYFTIKVLCGVARQGLEEFLHTLNALQADRLTFWAENVVPIAPPG